MIFTFPLTIKEAELIKAHADSYVAPYILAGKMYNMDLKELQEKYNALGANAKASEYGKKIAERIEKLEAVAIGKVAPDFTQDTPEGKPLSLYDIKGKVKIIDFWASWSAWALISSASLIEERLSALSNSARISLAFSSFFSCMAAE